MLVHFTLNIKLGVRRLVVAIVNCSVFYNWSINGGDGGGLTMLFQLKLGGDVAHYLIRLGGGVG